MKKFFLLSFLTLSLLSLSLTAKIIDFNYDEDGIFLSYDFSDITISTQADTLSFTIPGFNQTIGENIPLLPRKIQ